MVKVKICGITNVEDALSAVESGADALGFNFYSKSPRSIDILEAKKIIESLPPFVTSVGIVVNETAERIKKIVGEAGIQMLQFHGDESPQDCEGWNVPFIKAVSIGYELEMLMKYTAADAILLDAPHEGSYGGTGKLFDWSRVEPYRRTNKQIILSGGLSPDNVKEAVEKVCPYAVDACSCLENKPGKKNHARVREFIRQAKSAFIA